MNHVDEILETIYSDDNLLNTLLKINALNELAIKSLNPYNGIGLAMYALSAIHELSKIQSVYD